MTRQCPEITSFEEKGDPSQTQLMFVCLPVELTTCCWAKLPRILMAENVYCICSAVAIHTLEFLL